MSLETDLQGVIANTTALNATVQGKVDEIDAATAASIASTDARLATFNNTDYPAMQSQITNATSLRSTPDALSGSNTLSYVNPDTTLNPSGGSTYQARWHKLIEFTDNNRTNCKSWIYFSMQDPNYAKYSNVYLITVVGANYSRVKDADGGYDPLNPAAWKEGVSITLLNGKGGDSFYVELDPNRQDSEGNNIAGVYSQGYLWGGRGQLTEYANHYPTSGTDIANAVPGMAVPTTAEYREDPDGDGYFYALPVPLDKWDVIQRVTIDYQRPRYATATYNTTNGVMNPNDALDNNGIDPVTGVEWNYSGAMTRERLYNTGEFTYEPLA